jgi:hypothetical protein
MSSKSPLNISPNLSEVIPKVNQEKSYWKRRIEREEEEKCHW